MEKIDPNFAKKNTPLKFRIENITKVFRGWNSQPFAPLEFKSTDTLLILDAVWNKFEFLNYVSELKKSKNIRIDIFVHDVIPYYGDDYVAFKSFQNFRAYLKWIDLWADQIYCNSQYSKTDLVRTGLVRKAKDAIVIPLAHEFIKSNADNGHSDLLKTLELTKEKLDGTDENGFVLCVGTIEARKNQKRLIEAWTELHRERIMPLLVLAGKMGHQSEAIKIFLEREQPPVLILEHVDDHSLEYLYQHCKFTVFPSLFEGWGLPVGESLWFGKRCLASNATSIPEVVGGMANYFDPHSHDNLKISIIQLLDQKTENNKPEHRNLRRWQDVARDLLQSMTNAR